MCDPATAAMMMQGGGAGLSAGSSIASGNAAKKFAGVNADALRLAASDRLLAGKEEQAALYREASRVLGAQRVAFSGNNVRLDSGVAAEVQADTAREVSLAATAIRNNYRRQAWSLRREALGIQMQGDWAKKSGLFNAFGKLAGGGGDLFKTANATESGGDGD